MVFYLAQGMRVRVELATTAGKRKKKSSMTLFRKGNLFDYIVSFRCFGTFQRTASGAYEDTKTQIKREKKKKTPKKTWKTQIWIEIFFFGGGLVIKYLRFKVEKEFCL